MQREEFEQWLEDHAPEAIERIDPEQMPLKSWLKAFGLSLKALAAEGEDEDEIVDEIDY